MHEWHYIFCLTMSRRRVDKLNLQCRFKKVRLSTIQLMESRPNEIRWVLDIGVNTFDLPYAEAPLSMKLPEFFMMCLGPGLRRIVSS